MKVMRVYPAKPADVYLYATCLVDLFDPVAGLDAIALIEREGIRVHFVEKQTCCGQPAYTSGHGRRRARWRKARWRSSRALAGGGAVGLLRRHDAPPLPPPLSPRAPRWPILRSGVRAHRVSGPGLPGALARGRGGEHRHAHPPARPGARCRYTTARSLLGQLDGVTLHEQAYESECCGFGGTFSVRHPHISQAMVEDKTRHLLATGADTLVSADWGAS